KNFSELKKHTQALEAQSKAQKGYGYSLNFREVKRRDLGTQPQLEAIYFETKKDFLRYLGRTKEAETFKKDVQTILSTFPELKTWITKYPKKVITQAGTWTSLLKVCQYFREHPKPNLYIRELPIAVHTKFVEQHKGVLRELLDLLIADQVKEEESQFEKRFHLNYAEPLVRFKILDEGISSTFFSGLRDLSIPVSEFETLGLPVRRVLIVENKTSLYTALTLPKMEATIVIFGKGNAVLNIKNATWLKDKEILYWGDLDVQGFEILSRLREYFPDTKSILMDKNTFEKFFEGDKGTPSKTDIPKKIAPTEQELYKILHQNNWRLEQEKIPNAYVVAFFRDYLV
ncbi:MAG: Wadjet anti-phage system protein JetD domain-containing protein, partial [Bacteroidota bacterium]